MGICQAEKLITQEFRRSTPQASKSIRLIEIPNTELKQVLDKLFNSYDRNHDGYLDLSEI